MEVSQLLTVNFSGGGKTHAVDDRHHSNYIVAQGSVRVTSESNLGLFLFVGLTCRIRG